MINRVRQWVRDWVVAAVVVLVLGVLSDAINPAALRKRLDPQVVPAVKHPVMRAVDEALICGATISRKDFGTFSCSLSRHHAGKHAATRAPLTVAWE